MNHDVHATDSLDRLFARQGWSPFAFQREAWAAFLAGLSGLIHAPTGMGKTLAAFGGPIAEALAGGSHPGGLRVLWITPLRALARDTASALASIVDEAGVPWRVELRTGDVSGSVRARQRSAFPEVLVTTPESLSLLLSHADAQDRMRGLRAVIVDEWHELLGGKRGVQVELGIARLRRLAPSLRTWGLSATIGNTREACDVLCGPDGACITANAGREVAIRTLLPATVDRFPWGGHLGIALLPDVLAVIESARTTLLFTNTRSQAELWFQAIGAERPAWSPRMALHHGSLDPDLRAAAERGLAEGLLTLVVATSSLDLGVDFSPVEQVIQVGSPKGVARLLQRAGRSGHQPGAISRLYGVPTNAMEIVEFAAARAAAVPPARLESRLPLDRPLDVLVQHMVTLALGGGFRRDELLAEVRGTHAFRAITGEQFGWALEFASRGGRALRAYPQFRRIGEEDGLLGTVAPAVARLHRLSIGTITSDPAMTVRFRNGASLGSVEESFVARMRPGTRFLFAGRPVELVRVEGMTAYVRPATGAATAVPRWMGGRMPLSSQLAAGVREAIDRFSREGPDGPEMRAVAPLLELQRAWSRLPAPDELLIEFTKSRDGHHAFVYPFEGRSAHEGMAALVAMRIARRAAPRSVVTTVNDHGFELLSPEPFALDEASWRAVLDVGGLLEDLLECLNATELARRRFRDVARVAGLVFPGYPGAGRSARQLQMSAGVLYDVFARFDPSNLLLEQARREVLEDQLEYRRIEGALARIAGMKLVLVPTRKLTPFAFPLWVGRIREQVTTESFEQRVARMAAELEAEASAVPSPPGHAPRQRKGRKRDAKRTEE